jgi:hypothetical protein
MWSPLAESPPRSVAPASTNLDPDVRHQSPALGDEPLHLPERYLRGPLRQRLFVGQRRPVALPAPAGRFVGDLGHLAPVIAGVRHEVLKDHLLQVTVLAVDRRQGLQRGDAIVGGLADPDQDPARERDPQLARGADRLEAQVGVLGRRALMDEEVGADRLQHQPLRGRDLAQAGQVIAGEHAEVGVREQAALECPLAGPDDVAHEVVVSVVAKAAGNLRVHLGPLARQHEQLLGVSAQRLVEALRHLVRRVEVRPTRGERAVPAHATTRSRKRERVVAREGDAAHSRRLDG